MPTSKWLFRAITEGKGFFWKYFLGNGTKIGFGNQPRVRSSKNQLSTCFIDVNNQHDRETFNYAVGSMYANAPALSE